MTSLLRPVQRVTIVESVRDQLIALMEERALRPGDALPSERELMMRLEIGRSSLREALAGLVALGVLTVGAGKGYRVQALTLPPPTLPTGLGAAQIAELFEARLVLETGIAELACERCTEQDLADLESCLESIRGAQQAHRSTVSLAARFHLVLAAAAHNRLLQEQLQSLHALMEQVGAFSEARTGSSFADEQWKAHKVLLDTVRTRNRAAMREAMIAHLNRFAGEAHHE